MLIRPALPVCALLYCFLSPVSAGAQQQLPAVWRVTAGAGALAVPAYEGADTTVYSPIPVLEISYRDTVSLSREGLAYAFTESGAPLSVKAGVTFDGGRDEDDGSAVFGGADEEDVRRLRGTGDIDASPGIFGEITYDIRPLRFGLKATRFFDNLDEAWTARASVASRIPAGDALQLIPSAGAVWADNDYTDNYFGITPVQSANSGLRHYNPDAGFKHIDAGITAIYNAGTPWTVTAGGTVSVLQGDAADSPIVENETNFTFVTTLSYSFLR